MPSESDSKPLVGRSLGRYQLLRVLGRGAMGMVYEGLDTRLGRTVAIKTVLRSFLADDSTAADYAVRFEREAQAAARLNHPNIVALFDFGEQEDVSYIVMEFIRGRELAEAFKAGDRFTPQQTLRLMTELLAALGAAHDSGIVHRDVKPANVLIDESGRVKLADFGVARVVEPNQDRTLPGTMVGTPSAMAPEQILGQAVGSRTDIFSAGLIFYQLLTGKRPFAGSGPFGVQRAILHDEPVPPSTLNPELPTAVDAVLAKALAKAPTQRYNSAAAFSAAVTAALGPVVPVLPAAQGSAQDALDPDMTVVLPKSAARPAATTVQDNVRTPGLSDRAGTSGVQAPPTSPAPQVVPAPSAPAGALQDDATELRPGSVVPPLATAPAPGVAGRSGVEPALGPQRAPAAPTAAPTAATTPAITPAITPAPWADSSGIALPPAQASAAPLTHAAQVEQASAVAAHPAMQVPGAASVPSHAPTAAPAMALAAPPEQSTAPVAATAPAPPGKSRWPVVAVAAAAVLGVALWWTQMRTDGPAVAADTAPANIGVESAPAPSAGASQANVATGAVPVPTPVAPVAAANPTAPLPRPAAPPATPPQSSPGTSAAEAPGVVPGAAPVARPPVPGTGSATQAPQPRMATTGVPVSTPTGAAPMGSTPAPAAPSANAAGTAPAQGAVAAGAQAGGYGPATSSAPTAADSAATSSGPAVAPAVAPAASPAAANPTANAAATPGPSARPAAAGAGAEGSAPAAAQAPREAERKLGANHPRCVELRSRILLGDTLTPEQTTMFHTRCAR
jgi:serine/threonine protein kinase